MQCSCPHPETNPHTQSWVLRPWRGFCVGAQEGAEARPWLLPLLRQHVRGASLGFWAAQLLPLARALGKRAAAAGAASDQLLALQCQSLEGQLWDALPAFADGALDLADAFRRAPSPELGCPTDAGSEMRGQLAGTVSGCRWTCAA